MATPLRVPFGDLRAQSALLEDALRAATTRVLKSGWYLLGEELAAFEHEFASWLGAPHVIGVGSGTDAIAIALRACGVEPGDEVILPANTCVPTAAGIVAAGATPVLCDVDPITLTLDAQDAARRITPRTRAIVPVHLYGHPCDMDAVLALALAHRLIVVEDCAQAHGAEYKGVRCGNFGDAAAFSFYPTKNLGACGDAGAVITANPEIAARARALRFYGEDQRYHSIYRAGNSRLDEMQAAILRAKLPHLHRSNAERRRLAEAYNTALAGTTLQIPGESEWARACWHLYVIRSDARDQLAAHLRSDGIGTAIHYPIPIHLQPAYNELGHLGDFPVSERACREVLSLPLYPELEVNALAEVVKSFRAFT